VANLAEATTEALGPNTAAYSGSEPQKAFTKKPGIMCNAEVDEVTGLGRVGSQREREGKWGNLVGVWCTVKRKT
jgi:hypothetical protein